MLVGDVADVEIGGRPRSGIVAFNERDDVVQAIVQMTKGQNADQGRRGSQKSKSITEVGTNCRPG